MKKIQTQDFRTAIQELQKINESIQKLQINMIRKQYVFYHNHPIHCGCPHYMPCSLPNFLGSQISKNKQLADLKQITLRYYGSFEIQKWLDNNYDEDSRQADGINIFQNSWAQFSKALNKLNSLQKLEIVVTQKIIDNSYVWANVLKNKNVQVKVLIDKNWQKQIQPSKWAYQRYCIIY